MIYQLLLLSLISLTLASANVLLEHYSDFVAEEAEETLIQTEFYEENLATDLQLLTSPLESDLDEMWETFKTLHQKWYSSAEIEARRRMIWEKNLKEIQEHNKMKELHGYVQGINQFSDWTSEELKNHLTPFKLKDSLGGGATYLPPSNVGKLPKYVNWLEKGIVTPVRNQGFYCGSCYIFSALAALESQQARKTKKLVHLSVQNVLDCNDYSPGCKGGLMTSVFQYIKDNGGVDTDASYPYEEEKRQCRFSKNNIGATVSGFVEISKKNESILQEAVAVFGPVTAGINALDSLYKYDGGIYKDPDCINGKLNHAVLIVGYGKENGQDYWLVKNTWGTSWGLNGYVKIARNRNNMCGIANLTSFPFV